MIKLKEINIKPSDGYIAEFFDSVAAQPEGKFFRYERETTNNLIRSASYTHGARLGKKFSIHTVKEGETPVFAVGWTTKERAPRTRKPKTAAEVPTTAAPYEIGSGGSEIA